MRREGDELLYASLAASAARCWAGLGAPGGAALAHAEAALALLRAALALEPSSPLRALWMEGAEREVARAEAAWCGAREGLRVLLLFALVQAYAQLPDDALLARTALRLADAAQSLSGVLGVRALEWACGALVRMRAWGRAYEALQWLRKLALEGAQDERSAPLAALAHATTAALALVHALLGEHAQGVAVARTVPLPELAGLVEAHQQADLARLLSLWHALRLRTRAPLPLLPPAEDAPLLGELHDTLLEALVS